MRGATMHLFFFTSVQICGISVCASSEIMSSDDLGKIFQMLVARLGSEFRILLE